MRRRHRLGAAGDKIYGYTEYKGSGGSVPTYASSGWTLTDGWASDGTHNNVIATGRQIGCSRVKPGARGGWISSSRCSYQFKLLRTGEPIACRSLGDGMSASCRVMKKMPKGLGRARRRVKRRR